MDFEKLIRLRNSTNGYANLIGIETVEIKKGYAKGFIKITPEHLNPMGTVHGGVIFSLADTIGGSAAISHGNIVTTISSNINYINAASNVEQIIAVATEIKKGRTILIYNIEILDEKGKLLSTATFSYFNLGKKIE